MVTVGQTSSQTIRALVLPIGIALLAILSPAVAVAATSLVTTLPGANPFAAAVNQTTNRVYVSDAGGFVRVIDGDSNTYITTIAIPIFSRGIAVNPTTNKIYVAGYGNNTGDKLNVINGATNTYVGDIDIYPPNDPPFGSGPYAVAVNSGLNRVYVGSEAQTEVAIVDGSSDTLITRVPSGGVVRGIGVHTGTNRVYVSTNANVIRVLNFDGTFVTDIPGMNGPLDLVVNSLANRVYVVNYNNSTLSVIDTTSNTVINTFSAGIQPMGLAVNPARNRAYISGGSFGSVVYVVNLLTGGTEETVQLGLDMKDVEYNPVNDLIYASEFTNTNIRVLQDVGEVCTSGIESWWNTSWRRRRAIDINNGDISETFTNFPLLVKLDSSRIDYSKTLAGGNDLRFVAADDTTVLDYEIETWNPAGTSWIWVRVPTILGTNSTRIYMYFDNPGAPAGANPTGVWDANHRGVWHLKENPGGAPPQMKDSTANVNHGTAEFSPVQVAGQINGSLSFDGTNERDVNIPNTASLQLPTQMTISAWAKLNPVDNQPRLIVAKWKGGGSSNFWMGKFSTGLITFAADTGGPATVFCNIALVNDGNWHFFTGVAEAGGTLRYYIDGTECGNVAFTPPIETGTSEVRIGRSPDTLLQDWDGGIDEVRVESVARTPLWLKAQDRSMRDGYNTFGSEDGICNLRSIGNRSYGTGQPEGNGTSLNTTIGSRTVFGVGTAWRTANRGRGDRITIGAFTGTILSVDSETQLTMTTPSTVGGAQPNYTITRKFNSLAAWEGCIDGSGSCGADPAVTASLVTDNRGEIGIAYDDVVLAGPLVIDGTVANNTDAIHTITLTADNINRHHGFPGTGVVIDNGLNNTSAIKVHDDYVTVEWMEIKGGSGALAHGIEVEDLFISPGSGSQGASRIFIRSNLIHVPQQQILLSDEDQVTDVYNNITYGGTVGVGFFDLATWGRIRAFNNTFYSYSISAFDSGSPSGSDRVTLRNNLAAATSLLNDYALQGNPHPSSSNNMSAINPGPYAFNPSPAGGGVYGQNLDTQVRFVNRLAVDPNLHILVSSTATNAAANLSSFFRRDIDDIARATPWDIGADDTSSTTAVALQAFTAAGRDGAVDLAWTTASELKNLGFHVYRGPGAQGPWTRLTTSLIPGQGSSPTGASYEWRDGGVTNGTTYHYLLEDVETTGRTERHGPVSATPSAPSGAPGDPGGETKKPSGVPYGNPEATSLKVLERTSRGVLLELRTGGFYAVRQEDGTVRIEVPGFEESLLTGLPVKRGVVEAVAGRKVRLVSVETSEETSYRGLLLASPRRPELEVGETGEVLPGRGRRLGFSSRAVPAVEVVGTAFQGEVKKAEVLFAPFEREGRRLALSGRILARLEFVGTEKGEVSRGGSRGRSAPTRRNRTGSGVLAQLVVGEAGLYRVSYEDVFGTGARREVSVSRLRLSRQGEPVAYHVEPNGSRFRAGSALYFVSGGSSLNPEGEVVYELEEADSPARMGVVQTVLGGGALEEYEATARWEENKYYQAGLLEAEDLWQWDVVISPQTMVKPFVVSQLATGSTSSGRVTVWLQGASDFEAEPDHHVRIRVNGVVVGEATFEGKTAKQVEAEITAGILQEGANQLEIEDVGDTGAAYSMVFLDKFSVSYPRRLVSKGGRLEGRFERAGQAEVAGLAASSLLVDTTGPVVKWVKGSAATAAGVAFGAEAGHRYLIAASALRPTVRAMVSSTLRSPENQADYLVIGPRTFLEVAQPLLEQRRSQGLAVKGVSTEEIFQEFGHGEPSAEAVKEFLEYAYHQWQAPSIRYVLLLGDATYDPKDYLKTGVKNQVPAFMVKTSYLWTASDPTLVAVNGSDSMPDVALGRLSASSVDEARRLVEKVLRFENGGGNFLGRTVLVADNADLAGNFEQNANEIAGTLLATRDPRKIYYSQLGSATRSNIIDAFDQGASLVSYMGHGGTVVWASENIFNFQDVAKLAPQPQQPLLLTLNCLNGFFHFPPLNSLSEAFLKAEGKGAVAAFSPTGLSLNDPAHLFHKAVLAEILSGRHERLGDGVLAAQEAYADSGAFPELLSIYHLFGDPALQIR